MKKTVIVCSIAALLFAGCQQSTEADNKDLKAEEAAAREMFGDFNRVLTVQNVDSMAGFITDDALICGTDPSEIFSKEEAIGIWSDLAKGPEIDFLFLEENPFKMGPNGKSAVVVNQLKICVL